MERRSERGSVGVGNASQTRPDQTRVFLTAVCGVSGYSCIASNGELGSRPGFDFRGRPMGSASCNARTIR